MVGEYAEVCWDCADICLDDCEDIWMVNMQKYGCWMVRSIVGDGLVIELVNVWTMFVECVEAWLMIV